MCAEVRGYFGTYRFLFHNIYKLQEQGNLHYNGHGVEAPLRCKPSETSTTEITPVLSMFLRGAYCENGVARR